MKYTPILKWKPAEQGAIRDLTDMQKVYVLPMFEFLQKTELSKAVIQKTGIKEVDKYLIQTLSKNIPQDILLSWGDGRPFYADFTLISSAETKKEFSSRFIKNSIKLNLEPISVVNASTDSDEYIETIVGLAIKYSKSKVCVRFCKANLGDDDFLSKKLADFTLNHKISPRNISVLIDLKEYTDNDNYLKAISALKKVRNQDEYDNIIVASGAFPVDMSEITNEDNRRQRTDWYNWMHYRTENHGLSRYPAYADYTIRHPVYNPQTEKYRATATIKYTLENEWLFFKGERDRNDMYLANAFVLRALDEFYGRDFSTGDRYIDDRGLFFPEHAKRNIEYPPGKGDNSGAGSAPTWIRASINHHIAVVANQIANLGA